MGEWRKNLSKRYYLFNVNGEFIGEFTKKEVLKKLNVKESTVSSAIKRVSVILRKYYISHDKNFKLPKPKSYSHNPLLSKKYWGITNQGFKQANLDFLFEYEIGIFNQQSFLY